MKVLLPLLLLLLATFAGAAERPLGDLRHRVESGDLEAIATLKQKWEAGWSEQWRLLKAELKNIDHYLPGITLEWEMQLDSGLLKQRFESFELDGTFYSATEVTLRGDEEIEGSILVFDEQGQLTYRARHKDQVWSLEVFHQNSMPSVYRATKPFIISRDGPSSVPCDAMLTSGPPVPAVEAERGPC